MHCPLAATGCTRSHGASVAASGAQGAHKHKLHKLRLLQVRVPPPKGHRNKSLTRRVLAKELSCVFWRVASDTPK